MQESGWQQFCAPDRPMDQAGGSSRTIISFDCGYGASQITSGMRSGDSPDFDPRRVAAEPAYNAATGTQILAMKWRATRCIGDRQPAFIEHWYSAVWAYNGLAYVNNPNNPNYDAGRGVYDPAIGGAVPYQERVFGWMEHTGGGGRGPRSPTLTWARSAAQARRPRSPIPAARRRRTARASVPSISRAARTTTARRAAAAQAAMATQAAAVEAGAAVKAAARAAAAAQAGAAVKAAAPVTPAARPSRPQGPEGLGPRQATTMARRPRRRSASTADAPATRPGTARPPARRPGSRSAPERSRSRGAGGFRGDAARTHLAIHAASAGIRAHRGVGCRRRLAFTARPDEAWFRRWEPYDTIAPPSAYLSACTWTANPGTR